MAPIPHKRVKYPSLRMRPILRLMGIFGETELIYPPYSLPARPFGLDHAVIDRERDGQNIRRLAERHHIDYRPEREVNT